jgi:hypothetical protein
MALSNQRLNAKLRQYLEKFAQEWTFERLSQLGDAVHNEYEHDDDPKHSDFVQVHLQLLEHVAKDEDNYLHVSVDISDNRPGVGKGSAYRALCGSMFVHADGKTEVHTPKEAKNEV